MKRIRIISKHSMNIVIAQKNLLNTFTERPINCSDQCTVDYEDSHEGLQQNFECPVPLKKLGRRNSDHSIPNSNFNSRQLFCECKLPKAEAETYLSPVNYKNLTLHTHPFF